MRDDYYDDIEMGDADDEWFDEEDAYEEPYEEPEPVRRSEPRRRQERASERDDARRGRRGQESESASARGRGADRAGGRGRSSKASRSGERDAASTGTPSTGKASAVGDLLLLVFKIGLVAVFLIFMTTFFFGITQARDVSMEPAIKEGDLVIYYRPDKDYAAGDAIVVEYNGSLQVRRVVATAGDTVDISSDGGLIVNGSTQIENDIYTTTLPYTEGITFPVTVGTGEVFVLGDDRTSATDSRIYGTVAVDATKGAVMTVIRRRGI